MFTWIKNFFGSNSELLHTINSLNQSLSTLQDDYSALLKEKEDLSLKNDLLITQNHQMSLRSQIVSSILNARNENEGLKRYKTILDNNFLNFTKQENSLDQEAEMFAKLQKIYEDLKLIASCPELYKKTIVGVGGCFSSGKSQFISSFFQEGEAKLATGINPTTAIPTYVISDKENGLIGCSKNGGAAELSKIDPQIQSKMSHEFIESFGFNLKDIMPFVVLKTHFDRYDHICFVDTPGYNPSHIEDHTSEDATTAKDFLKNANVLLWLIDVGNGTIPKSDLDFLQTLNLSQKKLYIILNKSDLKASEELQEVLLEIASKLEIEDIEYEGISAYSSKSKKEDIYKKMSLQDFLDSCNHPAKFQEELLKQLFEIKENFCETIKKSKETQKELLGLIKSISLDLYQMGAELNLPIYQKIEKLKIHYSNKKEDSLQNLNNIMRRLQTSVNCVFGKHLEL